MGNKLKHTVETDQTRLVMTPPAQTTEQEQVTSSSGKQTLVETMESTLANKQEVKAAAPYYNAYVKEPSGEAHAYYLANKAGMSEEDRIQGDRTPAFQEFLYAKQYQNPAAGAKAPETPVFPEVTIPYYLQWDQRWAFGQYAGGYFGQNGCGPTVLSMVYEGLMHKPYLPDAMGEFANKNGYSTVDNGTAWTLFSEGAKDLGLEVETLPLGKSNMTQALDQGRPIVLVLGPGDFTSSGHYIMIRSYTDKGFQVFDPFSLANSQKDWPYERLEKQIRNIWAYSLP